MATTLNGWPAITNSDSHSLRTIRIPGTHRDIKVQADAAPLFAAFFADWQKEMPDRMNLNPGPVAGWVYRNSRFQPTKLSNHSSGTAVDVLWETVLPADNQPHMTAAEKKILDKILSRYVTSDGHRVLANGEWWETEDGMHTELSQSWDRGADRTTTLADVKNVIKRLGIQPDGTRKAPLWDGVVPEYQNVIAAEADPTLANHASYRLACRLADLGYFNGKPVDGKQHYPAQAVLAWHTAKGYKHTSKYGPVTHDKIFK